MSKKTKELVSNLIYDRYKYQDQAFYVSRKISEGYDYLTDFCVEFFFEYKKYLFLERQTDTDLVFYKFCSQVELGEAPWITPGSHPYNLRSISKFMDENLYIFELLFRYDEDLRETDKQIEKGLEIIFTMLNDLRNRDK